MTNAQDLSVDEVLNRVADLIERDGWFQGVRQGAREVRGRRAPGGMPPMRASWAPSTRGVSAVGWAQAREGITTSG